MKFNEMGIELCDIDLRKNLMFFYCRDSSSIKQLGLLINEDGFKNDFIKRLARIFVLPETFSVDLKLSESEKQRCETFLTKITGEFCNISIV